MMKTGLQESDPTLDSLDMGVVSFAVSQHNRCLLKSINAKACSFLGIENTYPETDQVLNLLNLNPARLVERICDQWEGSSSYQIVTERGQELHVTLHHQRAGPQVTVLIASANPSSGSSFPTGICCHDLLFILDVDYRIQRVLSILLEKHLKLPVATVVGQVFTDYFDETVAQEIHIALERSRTTKSKQTLFYHSPLDRDARSFKATIHWVERNQKPICYFAVDDVSISTDSFGSQRWETCPGILITDREGIIVFADSLGAQLLGYDQRALVGTPLEAIMTFDSSAIVYYCNPQGRERKFHIHRTPFPTPFAYTHSILKIMNCSKTQTEDSTVFVNLLLNLTFRLLQSPIEQTDEVLSHILEELGSWSKSDRAYIFLCPPHKDTINNTYEWCAPGISSQKEYLQKLPCDMFPKWMETLQHGQEIYIREVEDLPESWKAEQDILLPQEIKSLLIEPISTSQELLGFIGFDMVRDQKDWLQPVRGLLHFFAQILGVFLARLQSESMLREALQQSRQLAKEKERINQYMQNFYAKISHDIHNSLQAIVEAGNLLEQGVLTPLQRSQLSTIHASSMFLTNLLHDILDYSSFSKKDYTIKSQLFSVRLVVQNTMDALSVIAKRKGLSISIQYDAAIPFNLLGDRVRLAQIVFNLLHNAVKYSDQGPIQVSVTLQDLTAEQAVLNFSVMDCGKGIEEERVQQLFLHEGRAPVPSTNGGYGLGLSIVKQLVDAMNGTITVESNVGIGTSFMFSLPFALSDASCESSKLSNIPEYPPVCYVGEVTCQITQFFSLLKAQKVASYTSATIPENEGQILIIHQQLLVSDEVQVLLKKRMSTNDALPKRWFLYGNRFDRGHYKQYKDLFPIQGWLLDGQSVLTWYLEIMKKADISYVSRMYDFSVVSVLLVDDSVISREVLKQKLVRMHVSVATAGTGEEAIQLCEKTHFDFVFMDLYLPALDGIETAKVLMKQSEDVKIIATSAYQGEIAKERCEEIGIEEFLQKPVQNADLVALLRRYTVS